MWLSMDAAIEFGDNYIDIFNEHFEDYITEEIEERLWFAGKNILCAINSFIYIKNNEYELNELLIFVEKFVSEQLSHFDNDYSDYGFHTWR